MNRVQPSPGTAPVANRLQQALESLNDVLRDLPLEISVGLVLHDTKEDTFAVAGNNGDSAALKTLLTLGVERLKVQS